MQLRFLPVLLVVGALALVPGAVATADLAFAAEMPSEVEVGAPTQTVSVEGQETAVDTRSDAADGAGATVSLVTKDVDVSATGPSCKVPTQLKDTGDSVERCDAGSISTTASVDLVEVGVGLYLPDGASGAGEGEVESASSAMQMVDSPTARGVVLLAAAAGASATALYGLWRFLKWTGLAAVFPLYSHISDNEILDDPNRAAIYQLIQSEAGISTKDIAERLGLAWGTVTHHLHKLEKRRFVVSKKYGKYRRFFANGAGGTERKDELAVLRLDRTGDVAALIQSRPGLTQKEVSDVLGVSSSTVLWHVKRLEEVRLVTKVRDGKQVRYYPSGTLEAQVITPPASVA